MEASRKKAAYQNELSTPRCASLSWRRARTDQRPHAVILIVNVTTRLCLKATPNEKNTGQDDSTLQQLPHFVWYISMEGNNAPNL